MNWISFELINDRGDVQYTNDILIREDRVAFDSYDGFKLFLFKTVPHITNKIKIIEELDKFNRIMVDIHSGEWKVLPVNRGNYSFKELYEYNMNKDKTINTKNITNSLINTAKKGFYDTIIRNR